MKKNKVKLEKPLAKPSSRPAKGKPVPPAFLNQAKPSSMKGGK